jgi:hypothetical protein
VAALSALRRGFGCGVCATASGSVDHAYVTVLHRSRVTGGCASAASSSALRHRIDQRRSWLRHRAAPLARDGRLRFGCGVFECGLETRSRLGRAGRTGLLRPWRRSASARALDIAQLQIGHSAGSCWRAVQYWRPK